MVFLQELAFSFFFSLYRLLNDYFIRRVIVRVLVLRPYLVVYVNLVGLCYVLRSFCSGSSMCGFFSWCCRCLRTNYND